MLDWPSTHRCLAVGSLVRPGENSEGRLGCARK